MITKIIVFSPLVASWLISWFLCNRWDWTQGWIIWFIASLGTATTIRLLYTFGKEK